MARKELPPSKTDTVDMGSGEPWRCFACNIFVYNVCYDLFNCLISNDYWKQVQDEEKTRHRKLRPGSDYLNA